MDLTQFLAELRLDLKDSGTVWSDAELARCITRAVDDLSRHFPRERIYELTYKNAVSNESFTTPATSDTDYVVDAADISAESDGATLSLSGLFMDVPRPLIVTLTDANNSISSMTLIIKGTDIEGAYREEKFYRQDGKTQTGKVYFDCVNQVELNEITGQGAGDVIDVGTGSHLGVWVELANPIEPGSETVTTTDAATTYTRDTDYEMDYANGRINVKSGGSMAAGTSYYISYTKSKRGVDISSIIPELTRIRQVEYPVDRMPQQFVAFEVFGNLLRIGSQKPGESQTYLNDGEHLAIHYDARHSPPSLVSGGSYPEYLDQVVSIGAGAYALLVEAIQYEQQAVTDLASLRTELGLTTAIHTLVATALGKVATAAGLINSTADGVANADAITALAAANTVLDTVLTTSIDKATTGAEAYLDTYDGNINTVNLGADVAGAGANYARARVEIANARVNVAIGYVQEASQRYQNMLLLVQQSEAYNNEARAYIDEAQWRIAELNQYLQEADQYRQAVEQDMLLSDRFRAEGQQRLAEFQRVLEDRAQYRKRTASVPLTQPAVAGGRTGAVRTDRLDI